MAAKNLRSKNGYESDNDLAEDNLEQIRLLVANRQIDKLDTESRKRHDIVYGKLEHLKRKNEDFV